MDGTLQIQITVGAGALLNLLAMAYRAGRTDQKVAGVDSEVKRHDVKIEHHDVVIIGLDRRVSHIEGQRGIPLSNGD
jgi:hypothetical protein